MSCIPNQRAGAEGLVPLHGEKGKESYIADDMGVTQFNAKGSGGIDTSVHTSEDEVLFSRRQGEVALVEGSRVAS